MAQMSLTEQLYNLYAQRPDVKNQEACDILNISNHLLRNTKYKLKMRSLIDVEDDGSVILLKPFRENVDNPSTFKAEVYREMVDTYLEDFRQQATFNDRLAVGREIRLILEKI
ncbi:MAG: hypothetical protein RR384_08105 [Acidaminococcaceae bacterium]